MSGEKIAFEKKDDAKTDATRERSTIDFPYGDLEDAEGLVLAIHNNAGTSCTTEQLAGYMNQSAGGGGFRVKITTAKTFGLVENPRGQVVLSELGKRITDPVQQAAARVDSFMKVPLYVALYNKFKGNVMPPRAALTREIQSLGVVETQADRARQAFERSAERAGFFAHGRDRLVMPALKQVPPKPIGAAPQEDTKKGGNGGNGGGYDPLIQGLLNRLPPSGSEWNLDERATWVRALLVNFELVYIGPSDKKVTVEVKNGQ